AQASRPTGRAAGTGGDPTRKHSGPGHRRGQRRAVRSRSMRHVRGLVASWLVLTILALGAASAAAAPEGQLTWAVHISLAPTWFDPGEASGIITPFMVLYALHDALVKPMPGPGLVHGLAPSLAESWSMGEDGRSYDFVLRDGAKFHNGDPVTAADVK